jgi:hypothetical protein
VRRYIHSGNAAVATVQYRSTKKRNLPFLPMTSLSPGWCSGSNLPRTTCFKTLPVEECAISFSADATAGEVVKSWQIAFRLQTPLAVGEYVDISLPGFSMAGEATASTTGSNGVYHFAFEVMAKTLDPGFPVKLPNPQPEYESIGCYEDVRTSRAVGGGTCGNFNDADGVVVSIDACARIAADKAYGGFCIADGSTCMTSRDFFLEYDKYNHSGYLEEVEARARREFEAQVQQELQECLSTSSGQHKNGIANASLTDEFSNSSSANGTDEWQADEADEPALNASNASDCYRAAQRPFVYNATKWCNQGGMGGPGAMQCYELIRKPKVATKIAGKIRCGECAEWDEATQTLRFVAEETVEAGVDMVLGFNSSVLLLRAPVYGLARDDKSISIMHSADGRDVNAREKERAICTVPPIKPSNRSQTSCVPPTAARTVKVRSMKHDWVVDSFCALRVCSSIIK